MSLEGFLIWLLIGAIAGWLAGQIVKGYGFGLFGNIAVGIVGAIIGGWLFGAILIGAPLVGTVLSATAGAVILLLVLRVVKRA